MPLKLDLWLVKEGDERERVKLSMVAACVCAPVCVPVGFKHGRPRHKHDYRERIQGFKALVLAQAGLAKRSLHHALTCGRDSNKLL